MDPYAPDPYLGRALAAYRHRGAILPPYAPGYNPYGSYWCSKWYCITEYCAYTESYFDWNYFCVVENYVEYLHKKKAKESSVHRNPYETHDAYDAIRTQDADLAVRKFILSQFNVLIITYIMISNNYHCPKTL